MVRYPAKTAGPIEMPFGMWGGVGLSNHVGLLDGSPDPRSRRAILGDFLPHWIALQTELTLPLFAMISISKNPSTKSRDTVWGGHRWACPRSVYSTRRCGLLSNYFDLLFFLATVHWYNIWLYDILPTVLASQVMQSPLFAHFHPNVLTDWTLSVTFCVCMVHDHSSPGIEGQMKCGRLCFAWECVIMVWYGMVCCVCSMLFIYSVSCEQTVILFITCLVTSTCCLLTANNTLTATKTAACYSVSL